MDNFFLSEIWECYYLILAKTEIKQFVEVALQGKNLYSNFNKPTWGFFLTKMNDRQRRVNDC